ETLTRESVDAVLTSSTTPTPTRVDDLIEEAKDPISGTDTWERLKYAADELREELPNADITQTVTRIVDADDRPGEERAEELLREANDLLDRLRSVNERLDSLDEDSIVIIEDHPG
ncbi:hypothetical protein, partial [Halorubrum sp. SP3]|uniref:hypothetical protein n=1 Tax=Halorubrum sp. SP3 TaxID=1537265 RepID=UPI0013051125